MALALTLPLTPPTSVADLAHQAVQRVRDAGYQRAGVYMEISGVLRCVAQQGFGHVHDGIPPGVGKIGQAFLTGEPVIEDETASDGCLSVGDEHVAEICIPLHQGERIVGVLNIETLQAFDSTDVLSIMIFGDAIDQLLTEMDEQRPVNAWEALTLSIAELGAIDESAILLDRAAASAPSIVGMRSCMIRRVDRDRIHTVTAGPDAPLLDALASTTLSDISSWTGGKVSVYTNPDMPDATTALSAELPAWVAVPLPDGHPADVLIVAGDSPANCTPDAVRVLEVLASSVSQGLKRCDASAALLQSARRDSITGLEHASSFDEALSELDAHVLARGVALLIIDVDNLREVNEQLGHAQGDDLLRELSQRLTGALREGDKLFRIGGDEFGVIARCQTRIAAHSLAERLRKAARTERLTVSIGLTLHAPGHANDSPASLVMQADMAMRQAKRQGRDRVVIFTPEMLAQVVERAQLSADLNHALDNDQLRMVYQPLVDASQGRVVGAEALMRWTHPTRGPVSPGEFIPVAEASGAIVKMGAWAIRQVLKQGEDWGIGESGMKLSVNVAGQQLTREFVAEVGELLSSSTVPPERLTIELTESGLVNDEERIQQIQALRDLGVTVAIDDFGTGYSSLSYLRTLPIDILKIDRSFVSELADQRNAAVARTIIELTKVLALDCVAEGIETPEQVQLLKELGCDVIQGYHFARPMEAEDIPAFISNFHGQPAQISLV